MAPHDARSAEEGVRALYARRDAAGKRQLYASTRGEMRAWERTHAETAWRALGWAGLGAALQDVRVLDVGCGTGGWLHRLAGWGAQPRNLFGVELLEDRLREGKAADARIGLVAASGWRLPFPDRFFHLTSLFTVLSSLRDPEARRALGEEVRRTAAEGGWALVYDFRVRSPRSRDLVGIGTREVEHALGRPVVWRRSLTLAPPLARALGRFGEGGVVVAERLFPIFRTHRMYLVRLS